MPEEEVKPKVAKKKAKPRLQTYTNVTKANIFTSAGRCMPGQTIKLYISEGIKYPGLKK